VHGREAPAAASCDVLTGSVMGGGYILGAPERQDNESPYDTPMVPNGQGKTDHASSVRPARRDRVFRPRRTEPFDRPLRRECH
jgi:hypothetical protein